MTKAPVYTYQAVVENVIDGDTYDIVVDCGFGIYSRQRFRLFGIDCPESWRPVNENERRHGNAAKALAVTTLLNKTVTLTSHKMGAYGRFDAEIFFTDENKQQKDFATFMRESGMEKLTSY
jgi:micrococcal nuclease